MTAKRPVGRGRAGAADRDASGAGQCGRRGAARRGGSERSACSDQLVRAARRRVAAVDPAELAVRARGGDDAEPAPRRRRRRARAASRTRCAGRARRDRPPRRPGAAHGRPATAARRASDGAGGAARGSAPARRRGARRPRARRSGGGDRGTLRQPRGRARAACAQPAPRSATGTVATQAASGMREQGSSATVHAGRIGPRPPSRTIESRDGLQRPG